MTISGWAFAGIFIGLFVLLFAGFYGAVLISRKVEEVERQANERQVEESETPGACPCKQEPQPESMKQFRDKWGIGLR